MNPASHAPTRIVAGCLLGLLFVAAGADGPTMPPRQLFNGASLEGWRQTDFTGSGRVHVEEGAIRLEAGQPMTGITSTHRDLPKRDYELAFEAMRQSGDDFFAAATFPVGEAFVTLVNGGWGGSVTGLSSLNGADASENDTSTFFKYDNNRWYKFRARVTSRVIRCWIDDAPVIAVDYEGRSVGTRLETRANQPLGFSTWRSAGAIRAISVRPLTAAEIQANEMLEP